MSEAVTKSLRKVAKLWSVGQLRISFNVDHGSWSISGKCVCAGHPLESWIVGEFHPVGAAATLGEAMANALKGPPKKGVK